MEIVIDFDQLVQDLALEWSFGGIHERLVIRNVFLFDFRDLGVQLASAAVRELRSMFLVVVARLLFTRQQGPDMELAQRLRAVLFVVSQQAHLGIVVVHLRRAAGQDVSLALQHGVRVCTFEVIQQFAVAVEVVEVFEQAKVQCFADVRIRLMSCQVGSQVDGDLLVAQRRFQDRLVAGVQPVDRRLLLVLNAAGPCEQGLELQVVGHPREAVRV